MRWSGRSSGKAARTEMAPASTLSARPQGAPARQAVQRAVRTYSFGFAAVLAIGLRGAVSVPIILGLGLAVGVLNGLLIIVLRVQAIVVTLAMFFSLQGVVLFVAPNPVSLSGSGWIQHLAGSVGPVPGAVFTIGLP